MHKFKGDNMIKELMTSNRKEKEIDYNEVLKKMEIQKEFLISIKNELLNSNKRINLDKFFRLINTIIFGGFDYYYADDVKKILMKDNSEINQRISLLINEEHIDKLRTIVDCFPTLEFIDYDNKQYVWYKNTNVYCNLIPFERKDGQIIVNDDGILQKIKDNHRKHIYDNLQYKVK